MKCGHNILRDVGSAKVDSQRGIRAKEFAILKDHKNMSLAIRAHSLAALVRL